MNTSMAWLYLIVGGLFEAGWPIGLKMAETPGRGLMGWLIATLCMAASMAMLYLAQREISIGTAYAVWTGLGAVGVAICGAMLFGERMSPVQIGFMALIVVGVVGAKLATPA